MFLIGTNIKRGGHTIRENWVIPQDKYLLDKRDNCVYLPDTGVIYDLIFYFGLDEDSINMACQYALNKVKEQL